MQLLNAKDAVFGVSFALKFYEVCQGGNSIYIVNCMLCLISHLKNKSLHGTEANIWDKICFQCVNMSCRRDKYA